MTRKLLLLLTFCGLAFAGLSGVAQAAPGDCLILAGNPVCEPYPTPDVPPYYSICTPLPSGDVAPLVRKSCQTYLTATDEAVGDPQVFIYAPDPSSAPSSTPSSAPTTTSAAPSTSARVTSSPQSASAPVAPVVTPRTITRTSVSDHTVTAAAPSVAPVVETVTSPVPCVANAVRGMPGFDVALDQDNNGVSCESSIHSVPPVQAEDGADMARRSVSTALLLGIATVAALVLLLCLVIPPVVRRFAPGRHRG